MRRRDTQRRSCPGALHERNVYSPDDIAENLRDNARFSVFALADTALAGNARGVARILRVLKAEGEAPVLVLWALAREMRELARMAQAIASGRGEAQVLDEFRVWQRRVWLELETLALALGGLRTNAYLAAG